MNILIVEDDYLQADSLREGLIAAFPGSKVERISTENEFRARFEEIVSKPPAIIILDVMLRWTDPGPEMPESPEDVRRERSNRAGLRCRELLASSEQTRHIPVIFYTVLERADLDHAQQQLPPNTTYVSKDGDLTLLLERIRELTR